MLWRLTGILVLAYLALCLAWVAWLGWRRLGRAELRGLPLGDQVRQLGLGVLLLPVIALLAGPWGPAGTPIGFATPLAAVALWTFAPRSVTAKVVPVAVVLLGLDGFLRIRDFMRGDTWVTHYGIATTGYGAAYPQLLLLQAYLFTGLGLYLLWRASETNPLVIKLLKQPARTPGGQVRPRWGLLLLPLTGMWIELLGRVAWLGIPWWSTGLTFLVAVAAVLLTFRFPAIAGDLTLVSFASLGLYGVALGLFWPTHLLLMSIYTADVRYGTVLVDSRTSAIAAGVEGLALIGFGLWLVPRALDDRTRALLRSATDAELAGRVVRLTRTRADAVDAATAELRRLERDLHDGAQARLVALGMSLRAAERMILTNPVAAAALVAEARETSAKVLDELRGLVRGICPPVLVDRGLADAVRALALDTPLHTEVEVELDGRPELPVETACYFAVAEALTNAVKHSGARHAQVRIGHCDGALRVTVTDDGAGGADPQRGSGLLGLERRLGTFDGVLAVNSPPGGPTIIAIEVPCALTGSRPRAAVAS
jgi:signal transduction histidine kinase